MPPAELVELLTSTAAGLGARLKTDAEITAEAKEAVAVVERQVVGRPETTQRGL